MQRIVMTRQRDPRAAQLIPGLDIRKVVVAVFSTCLILGIWASTSADKTIALGGFIILVTLAVLVFFFCIRKLYTVNNERVLNAISNIRENDMRQLELDMANQIAQEAEREQERGEKM